MKLITLITALALGVLPSMKGPNTPGHGPFFWGLLQAFYTSRTTPVWETVDNNGGYLTTAGCSASCARGTSREARARGHLTAEP
jgi:hypothetical protein